MDLQSEKMPDVSTLAWLDVASVSPEAFTAIAGSPEVAAKAKGPGLLCNVGDLALRIMCDNKKRAAIRYYCDSCECSLV